MIKDAVSVDFQITNQAPFPSFFVESGESFSTSC